MSNRTLHGCGEVWEAGECENFGPCIMTSDRVLIEPSKAVSRIVRQQLALKSALDETYALQAAAKAAASRIRLHLEEAWRGES